MNQGSSKREGKSKGLRGHCENCGEDVIFVERRRIEQFRVVGVEWVCPFCGKAASADNHLDKDGSQDQESKGKGKRLGVLFDEGDALEEGEKKNGLSGLFGDEKSRQDNRGEVRSSPFLTDASEIHCCRECFHCTFNLYHCHCCFFNKDVDPSGDCKHFKSRTS